MVCYTDLLLDNRFYFLELISPLDNCIVLVNLFLKLLQPVGCQLCRYKHAR